MPEPPPPAPPPEPEPEFIAEGLTGRSVNGLFQLETQLLATTDDGLFGKGVDQTSWQRIGLAGTQITDLAFLDTTRWLAAVPASDDTGPRLLETVNRGSNWTEVSNDFGGDDGAGTEPIHALYFEKDSNTLYATGNDALASSTNAGRSWELLVGDWAALSQPLEALNLNSAREQLWYGGQNAIEQMVLRRYDLDSGAARAFPDLLPNPSTIKHVAFSGVDADLVLASGEGGIARSTDNGESWSRPLGDVDFRFYFDVAFDPTEPDTVYTAGWEKGVDGPQPLILEVSTDAGASFESVEYSDDMLRGGVFSVLPVTEGPDTVLYVGLDGGGIFKILDPDAI